MIGEFFLKFAQVASDQDDVCFRKLFKDITIEQKHPQRFIGDSTENHCGCVFVRSEFVTQSYEQFMIIDCEPITVVLELSDDQAFE